MGYVGYGVIGLVLLAAAAVITVLLRERKLLLRAAGETNKDDIPEWAAGYDMLSIPIYIIDERSCELLFCNKHLKEVVGETVGQKCYKALCGLEERCERCTTSEEINETGALTKEYYNVNRQKYYRVYEQPVQWTGGKTARLCLSVDITDSKRQELESRRIHSMYSIHEAILSSASMLFFAVDHDCNVLYVNEVFQETVGHQLTAGQRMPVEKFYVQKDVDGFYDRVFPEVMSGRRLNGEVILLGPEGQEIPLRYASFPVLDDKGNIFAYATIGEDITLEKKQAETARWQSAVIEYSSAFIGMTDKNKEVFYLNPSFLQAMGWSDDKRHQIGECYTEDYRQTVIETGIPQAMNGIPWEGSGMLQGKDKPIPIEQHIFPIYDQEQNLLGVATTMFDVTEKRKNEHIAEEQLRSQAFLSEFSIPFTKPGEVDTLIDKALGQLLSFLHADRISIHTIDEDGIFYCSHEKVYQQKYPSIQGSTLRHDVKALYEKLAESSYVYYEDAAVLYQRVPEINRDGKTALYIPLMLDGNYVGLLACITIAEPTVWSESECHLAAMAASIIAGAIVIDRNERSLRIATKEAQAANLAKSQFLSNMSHEIRTPMNAIIGMINVAKKTDDIQESIGCLEVAESSSQHLLSIINDVLDLSKIEAGNIEIEKEPFEFPKLLHDLLGIIVFSANEKQQKLVIYMESAMPVHLIGDATRYMQVFMNVLSNAIKFSERKKKIFIALSSQMHDDDTVTITASVRDQGIGMNKEQMGQLFQPFQQADSSISKRFGGTGLGLTISKRLVNLMNGDFEVKSTPEVGSTFTFTADFDINKEKKDILDLSPPENIGQFSILLVDNDMNTSCYAYRKMQEWGIEFTLVDTPEQAIEKINEAKREQTGFELMMVDDHLEECSGIEAVIAIREQTGVKLPTVLVTALDASTLSGEARKAGIEWVRKKPLFLQHIIELFQLYNGVEIAVPEEVEEEVISFRGKRIMVVEDIEINREIVTLLLEPTEAAVIEAEDGQQAVALYEENPEGYDIILMDIQMPFMDGLEATRQIRAKDHLRSTPIPIIALTANAFQKDVEECLSAGMDDHISKPIYVEEMLQKIQRYIEE